MPVFNGCTAPVHACALQTLLMRITRPPLQDTDLVLEKKKEQNRKNSIFPTGPCKFQSGSVSYYIVSAVHVTPNTWYLSSVLTGRPHPRARC